MRISLSQQAWKKCLRRSPLFCRSVRVSGGLPIVDASLLYCLQRIVGLYADNLIEIWPFRCELRGLGLNGTIIAGGVPVGMGAPSRCCWRFCLRRLLSRIICLVRVTKVEHSLFCFFQLMLLRSMGDVKQWSPSCPGVDSVVPLRHRFVAIVPYLTRLRLAYTRRGMGVCRTRSLRNQPCSEGYWWAVRGRLMATRKAANFGGGDGVKASSARCFILAED